MLPSASRALIAVKLIHTLAWAFFAGCVLVVFYDGLTGRITPVTGWAIAFVLLEAAILFYFRWTCPLTIVARRYSNSDAHNFDIYLPEWLAKHNKTIFTALFVLGLVLVGVRYWQAG